MIDLSALGLAVAQASHQTGKSQKGGHAHEQADDAKSFDDFIGRAGKKIGHKGHGNDADAKTGGDGKSSLDRKLPMIDLRTVATDASAQAAAGKDEAADQAAGRQGRIDLSGDLQQLLQGKAGDEASEENASETDDPAKQSTGKAATAPKNNVKLPTVSKDATSAASDKTHADPAQELRAMLDPAQDTADGDAVDATNGKSVRKGKAGDGSDDTGDVKAQIPNDANAMVSKAEAAVVAQAVPHHAVVKDASAADASGADAEQGAGSKIQAVAPDDKAVRTSDIALLRDQDSDDAQSAGDDTTDFVSVLEARRYLGFSSEAPVGGNANTLTNAIKTDPSLAQLLQDGKAGASQTGTEVNTLKLQMSPEHLGNMTASLRLKGDELSVEVRVETVDAYRQLSQDHDGIVKALKDHGFSIDQVSIQLAPAARADSGQTGSNQSQSGGGQQNLQDGSQGDTARQREDSARRNANQNNWTGNERTASLGDTGNSTDDTRSGNLYL